MRTSISFAVLPAAFVCAWLFTAQAQNLPDALASAQGRYRSQINDICRRRDEGIGKLRSAYLEQVKALLGRSRAAGDLNGVLAAQTETNRFSRARDMARGDIVSAPAELRAMQENFLASKEKLTSESNAEIVDLTDRYMAGLERYQRQAVQENRISDAMAARQEIEDVKSSPHYLIASTFQPQQPAPQPPDAVPAEPAQQPWDAPQFNPQSPAVPGLRVYPQKEAPAVANLAEQQLHFTSMKSRASIMRVTAKLYVYMDVTDERGSRSRSTYYSVRATSGMYTYYPRLKFTPAPRETTEKWMLVFEYFTRPLDGQAKPSKVRTEHIKLATVKPGAAWVADGAGVQMWQYEARQQSGAHSRTFQQGSEYFGVIASIYDEQGQLVFQRTDQRPLAEHASDTLPQRLNDPEGGAWRVGSRGYYEGDTYYPSYSP